MSPNPQTLILHIDIFIIVLVIAVAFSTIPRAVAFCSSNAKWGLGYLHSTSLKTDPGLSSKKDTLEKSDGAMTSSGVMSEESHTYTSHKIPPLRISNSVPKTPSHIPAWSTVLPSTDSFLRQRIDIGFSLGQLLVLVIYLAILLYASFIASNPVKDPMRAGLITLSQLPIVYVLGTKNNLIGLFVGMGYERLNYIHRFAGSMVVLLANIHGAGFIYRWTFTGKLTANLKHPSMAAALSALIALDVLFFFSTSFWRRKAYNVFVVTHVVCFFAIPPLIYMHQKVARDYIFATIVLYGTDRLLRLLKTRVFNARIRPIPDLGLTRIEIPALNEGWRAGQHVRVRVLSSGMGLTGWAEEHPFTIASVAKTPEGLVLMCKNVGRWTKKLYELATVAGYGCEDGDQSRTVTVVLDGPYGGPGYMVYASFSAAMFVVGGSGITFALAAIQELVQRAQENSSKVKLIELVWCVQNPAALDPLIPLFSSLIQSSGRTPLNISVYYTRAVKVPPTKDLLPGLTLDAGRPSIAQKLDAVISRAASRRPSMRATQRNSGVFVGVCGPVEMSDEVSKIVSAVDGGRKWAVGGIEIHEESFSW